MEEEKEILKEEAKKTSKKRLIQQKILDNT